MTDNTPDAPAVALKMIHIVFDGPPGPEAGRFVEAEDADGKSINVGTWHERSNGYWELRIAAWNTRPTAALPSEDVERVARAIAKDIDRQDCDAWAPADDWDFTMPYLDQGEVNYLEVARAAVAAMGPGANCRTGAAMMDDMAEAKRIAAGLSKAQLEYIQFGPYPHWTLTTRALTTKRLLTKTGPPALTPLGLAVRAALLANPSTGGRGE